MARAKVYTGKDFRVALEGPFFERDPAKTVRQNIRGLMEAIASEAEDDIRRQISSRRMPHSTGHSAAHVRGRTKSLSGKQWEVTAVVSMDTRGMDRREAVRTQAAMASIERRWRPFAKTRTNIRRSRAVISANLTKGLT